MSYAAGPTVLIADDDAALAEMLSIRFADRGLRPVVAADALAALNAIRAHQPALVCLDVDMPAGNGLSVCEMMGSDPNWRNIPVIILTGSRDPETVRRCHEMCAYYVIKGGDVWSRVAPLVDELLSTAAIAGDETPMPETH